LFWDSPHPILGFVDVCFVAVSTIDKLEKHPGQAARILKLKCYSMKQILWPLKTQLGKLCLGAVRTCGSYSSALNPYENQGNNEVGGDQNQ
jgi:hypothetical protein